MKATGGLHLAACKSVPGTNLFFLNQDMLKRRLIFVYLSQRPVTSCQLQVANNQLPAAN
jgi:hypothetical protein